MGPTADVDRIHRVLGGERWECSRVSTLPALRVEVRGLEGSILLGISGEEYTQYDILASSTHRLLQHVQPARTGRRRLRRPLGYRPAATAKVQWRPNPRYVSAYDIAGQRVGFAPAPRP
ncbi:unnamed protein product [Prorocentrum cordatum]|uniref:Uncharacterized protein n=1 Tax=Prorocentrum cordatum TaxID=2364126 RepID=A0ABN9PTR9_9DINO|nr:unnamed protein product [Polarella glacialis]